METIHLKTVDPVSQELLRSAAQRGISLGWERYEKQQPQDGFLRLGLCCPYGCMQGPCRIDPFGRGADKGLCGLDRDTMVAATLLRICLQGAMDALGLVTSSCADPGIKFPAFLEETAARSLENFGNRDLSTAEIFNAMALLQRPSNSCEQLLNHSVRLSMLTLGLLEALQSSGDDGTIACRAGYGLVAEKKICIGLAGRVDPGHVESLFKAIQSETALPIQPVSMGEWISTGNGWVPFACSSGEAELLLSSGSIHSLVAGPGTDPALREICNALRIPVTPSQAAFDAGEVVQQAGRFFSKVSNHVPFADPKMIGEGRVFVSSEAMCAELQKNPSMPLMIVGGTDMPQQPHGYLPVELVSLLRGDNCQVAAWGDAALWMVKNGMSAAENENPVHILDDRSGPVIGIQGLAAAGRLESLMGVCFTGLKNCRDLNVALALAGLGLKIGIAVPIPLWGSETANRQLAELLNKNGGKFIHFDHPAQPQELLECFSA